MKAVTDEVLAVLDRAIERRLQQEQTAALVVWLVSVAAFVGVAVWIDWRLVFLGLALLWSDTAGGRASSAMQASAVWRKRKR